MMRILLVRHGQSEWNADRRLQGQADIDLSDLGRRQAIDLRTVIEAIGPCRAITSDLKRAVQTADLLGAGSARQTAALRETDVGHWTGRSIADIRAEDDIAYQGWRAGTNAPPGGEIWAAFRDRVRLAIDEESAVPCANLLVICHGGVIRALLESFLDLSPSRVIPVAPASLSVVRATPGKLTRLELFNHRPGNLEFDAPD